jgi:lipopolysaccharide transport system permease protein
MLGIVWAFIPPIVWAVGFTVARQNNIINVGEIPGGNYTAFVMIGVSMWQVFNAALVGPLQSLNTNRSLLTRVSFPREIIIMADILKQLFTMLINLLVITVAFIWFQIPVTMSTFLAIPAMLSLVLLGTVVGIFLAPVGLLYKDITNSLPIIMLLGMACTPVMYPRPHYAGFFAEAVRLNPVTALLETARQLALGDQLTLLPQFFTIVGLSILMLVVGMAFLRNVIPVICERWGA